MASPGKPALYTAASRTFLPRDDVTLRPVSASVTSRSFIESAGRIELVFGTEAFFDLSYGVGFKN